MAVELFFRNLFLPAHKTRWSQRRYTSSQEPHGIPLAWAEAAVADQPEAAYPLATVGVLFLPTAREKFFAFVQALKANPNPPSPPPAFTRRSPCNRSSSERWPNG